MLNVIAATTARGGRHYVEMLSVQHLDGGDVLLDIAGDATVVDRLELLAALEVEGDELKVAA